MRIPLLWKLMALLIVVPLLDVGSILLMNHFVNGWITFGTIVGCGVVGAVLVRREGIRTWNRLRYEIARGQIPETPLMDGVLVLISGAFLMTPGPLTDLLGLSLLLPPVRAAVRMLAYRRVQKMLHSGATRMIEQATIIR
ncbi:MAG TPA: FxsA family protein [Armatimonadota bacterium]|nr:FxsA family protein [Armatimonadota bacterium]